MDPTAVAQQPTVWLEGFLTTYGPAMQAFGFLGWFIVGITSIALTVAFIVLVPSLRRAALDYSRLVESKIGPRITEEDIVTEDSTGADIDTDKFVE